MIRGATHWRRATLLALTLLTGTAQALPDLARGLAALERGEPQLAERDLVPLAERGYLQAQLALAAHYAALGTEQGHARAAAWYRLAADLDPHRRVALARVLIRIGDAAALTEAHSVLRAADADGDADALRELLRLYRQHPPALPLTAIAPLAARAADSGHVDDRSEAIAWYRHAALSDPRYETELQALCEEARSWLADCYADLLRRQRALGDHKRMTALLKEVDAKLADGAIGAEALERIARSLVHRELPGAPAPQFAYPLLRSAASRSPEAQARMAKLLIETPEIDADADPVALLQQALDRGSDAAALQLGRLYLEGQMAVADPQQAQRLLERAAASEPSAHFYLGRLHERGYHGRADVERALQHYLQAARAGYARADLALAQMYSKNRGVRPDAVAAYAFALLARHQAVVGSEALLQELNGAMTQERKASGQRIANAELSARAAAVQTTTAALEHRP